MLTEFKGKSNMMTWSTSKSNPRAAKSVQTKVGQSPSSLLNLARFATLYHGIMDANVNSSIECIEDDHGPRILKLTRGTKSHYRISDTK